VSGDIEGVGSGEEFFEGRGPGVIDGGEEDVVVAALWIFGGGIEEGEEDLGHLFEVLVAQTTEEQGTGLRFGELSNRGAQGPGAGGIVGYVEEDVGAFREGEEFEAAGPSGIANACFYCCIR
jgi:hypothetical protein